MRPDAIAEVLNRPAARELLSRNLAHMAYVAADGTPRAIPIAFGWNGAQVVMYTTENAPKVSALRRADRVALTIDTEELPPTILLIRGRAELELVDGVPDEYVDLSTRAMTPEQRTHWEADVRALYDRMVRIVVAPTWAKLIDFETTLPSAVEELVRRRESGRRGAEGAR